MKTLRKEKPTQLTLLLVFVRFLVNYCENGVCTVYYLQNIGESKDLLSYPKVVIKRKHLRQISALSLRIFTGNSVSVFHRVQRLGLNTRITFSKLNSYLVIYKSLSLHEVNKPSTESFLILSQQISGSMSPTRSLFVTLCKPVFLR